MGEFEYKITEKLSSNKIRILRKILKEKPAHFLEKIGELFLEQAKQSFEKEESPDGKKWLPRYPNQGGDIVNIAGIVEDLNLGRRIDVKRFQNRPVGQDTGDLKKSFNKSSIRVSGNILTIESNVDYSERFAEGGESTQNIDNSMKKRLKNYLRRAPNPKLNFLLDIDTLSTKSPPRPFFDFNKKIADGVNKMIIREIRKLK